jgi:hypothetical protein
MPTMKADSRGNRQLRDMEKLEKEDFQNLYFAENVYNHFRSINKLYIIFFSFKFTCCFQVEQVWKRHKIPISLSLPASRSQLT